jgi:multiple sugar transport system ATP-binding protein
MANLSLKHVYKVYPNGVKAVSDFNMEIKDKEFIVFVGPSGCGKSTTLRMIAGLEDITAGEIYIGNDLINDVEPKDRDIAMVFQNYALYPHMTVYDNMAFGLKLRHMPREEIHKKVLWAADILKLTEYLDRKPRAMSGGQRQRVALGRAILRNPKVFLLDEPLSNLDAKLRTEMRTEIAKLHDQLKTTFIYVTHDQVEAMTLGTRVVVMKLGRIQQVDTPQNLYDYPDNKFVAGFIGTPQMNFFEVTLKREKEEVVVKFDYCDEVLRVSFADMLKVQPKYLNGKIKVTLGIRCEDISLDSETIAKSKNIVNVKVSHFERLGDETLVYGDLNMKGDGYENTSTRVIVKAYHGALPIKQGDVISVAFDMKKAHFFDLDDEKSIAPRIPEVNLFDCSIEGGYLSWLGEKVKLPSAIEVLDSEEAELFIPSDAIELGGTIDAKLNKIDEVNGVKVGYLEKNGRTFFVLLKDDVALGEVKIKIDFKRITIRVGEEDVVLPLPKRDAFIGGFTNSDYHKKALNNYLKRLDSDEKKALDEIKLHKDEELASINYRDAMKRRLKQEFEENSRKLREDRAYKVGTKALSFSAKRKVDEEYRNSLENLKKNYNERLQQLNNKENSNPEMLTKVESIDNKYRAQADVVKNNFDEYRLLAKNGDRDFAKFSKEETKESTSEYREKLAQLKEELNKNIAELEASKNEKNAEDVASKKAKLVAEYEKKKDELSFASKLFYSFVDGGYVQSPLEINKKVIQALGTSLFWSVFRYEFSHDSLHIVEDGGFKATVKKVLDYGEERYLKCETFGKTFYIAVDPKIDKKPGDKILVAYDLNDVEVYEDKFDIRLF